MTAPGGVIATVYVDVLPRVQDFARDLRRSLRQSSRELRTLDREIEPVSRAIRQIGVVATGIVPGVRLARTSLLALGGHAVLGGLLSTAGALTTLSGVLVPLPAAGVAAASVMGTLAVGLRGVGDAIKDFDDVEAFNAALEDMSTNARATLGVLNEFRDEINVFRDSVQDRLFAGLEDVGRGLIETFLPRLQTHFGNLADIINGGAKELAAFATSARSLADFDEITANVENSFSVLRLAIQPAASAVRDIVTVGSRGLPLLAGEVVMLTQRFSSWISTLRATGELDAFVSNAIGNFRQLINVVINVGRSIAAILGAAQESGNGLLDTLEELTGRMADFLESARAQAGIQDFLDEARQAGQALLPVLLALGDLLVNHVLPVLTDVATRVGPAVARFFDGLGGAIDLAAPGIRAFATGFAAFIDAIVPILPLIGQLIGQLGTLVGVLAAKLGPVIADIATAIGNILLPILQALTAVFMFINPEILKFIAVLATVVVAVAGLVTVIRGVQALFGLFAGGLGLMASGATRTQGAMGRLTGFLGGPWGIAIGAATVALGLFMSSADETEGAVNGLRGAMETATGSAKEAGDEWIRQKLEQDGVAATAEKYKITIDELIAAYKGVPGAAEAATRKIVENGEASNANHTETKALLQALQDGPATYEAAIAGLERYNQATNDGIHPTAAWRAVLDSTRVAIDGVTAAMTAQQQKQLEAINSEIAYFNQLERTRVELNEGTRSLDVHTQEGRDNLSVLTQLAAAGAARINDLRAQGASTAEVTAQTFQMQQELIGMVAPFFQTREAAIAYLQTLGLIPRTITTTLQVNVANAISAVNNFVATMLRGLGIPGRQRGGPMPADQWTVVGEDGPELVRFGRSSRVFSNDESERMASDVGAIDQMTGRRSGSTSATTATTMTGDVETIQVTDQLTVQPTVNVYLDGREVTGMIDRVLTDHERRVVRLISVGAGRRS